MLDDLHQGTCIEGNVIPSTLYSYSRGASSYFAGMVAGAGERVCDIDTTEAVDEFTTQVWDVKNLALSNVFCPELRKGAGCMA